MASYMLTIIFFNKNRTFLGSKSSKSIEPKKVRNNFPRKIIEKLCSHFFRRFTTFAALCFQWFFFKIWKGKKRKWTFFFCPFSKIEPDFFSDFFKDMILCKTM
jgi:hypothetical protein